MNKIVIICGPTAVGKTKTAVGLAKKTDSEIISSDSMQIYKDMDIGTAKVTKEEMQGVKHHMIDIVSPFEEFSVSDYYDMSSKIIKDLFSKNKLPIIAGGTGLYINSLVYKMNFNKTARDDKIREKYKKIHREKGTDYLYSILLQKDEKAAEKIEKNNIKRVIRALEIIENNDSMTTFDKVDAKQDYEVFMYVLKLDRKILYQRINQRVDEMISQGLIDEVKKLLETGLDKNTQSMKAIGYRQIIEYLEGNISKDEAIELIKRDSRRYAKRQYTWFKRYDFAKWIDTEKMDTDSIIEKILEDINSN